MFVVKWLYEYLKHQEYKKYRKKMKRASRYANIYKIVNLPWLLKRAEKLLAKYYDYLKVPNKYKRKMLILKKIYIFLGNYLYIIQYMMLHRSADNVGKDPKTAIENKGSMLMYICYPARITYGMYDTHAYYVAYDKKNEQAKVPLSLLKPFEKKIMTESDIKRMNYRLLNKIFDSIDQNGNDNSVENF
jgi:hypothetical protein